jgi:hypothetical protein
MVHTLMNKRDPTGMQAIREMRPATWWTAQ